jgi:cyclopropane-fatty-acyl-phospholipid synthase
LISERVQARRAEALALFDEPLCRMGAFSQSLASAAFQHEEIAVFQAQLSRRIETVPLTRD